MKKSKWWCNSLFSFILFLSLFTVGFKAYSQSGLCDPITPFFNVNLSGNPSGTFISSPAVPRAGLCCTNSTPDRCIEFSILLDPQAVAINFSIVSGAVPPGAMYYQIACGPPTPVGQPICISGPGPHTLTFCKPGNNQNTYAITSIAGPVWGNDIVIGDGCNKSLHISGMVESTITWNDITGGGIYNSYLNCTSGCDSTLVTPQAGYPAFVDYVVCGIPNAQPCTPNIPVCDTVRVNFVPPLFASISPNPAAFCENEPGILLTASVSGGDLSYNFLWTNSSGNILDSGSTYFATTPGTYFIEIHDGTYPGCPSIMESVTVTMNLIPVVIANDNLICGNSAAFFNGSISNGIPGVWTGGNGNYSPGANSINGFYYPSAAELAAGFVNLTLTSQGLGGCPEVSDIAQITFLPGIFTDIIAPSVLCTGNTETLYANVSGGTSPFTFSWNTGETSQSISVTTGGTYSVTVADSYGCVQTVSVTVPENPPLIASASPSSTIACNSAISVNASGIGGTGIYSYLWNTGDVSQNINVYTGTYIVTITDDAGCMDKDTVSVIATNSVLDVTVSGNQLVCFGDQTTLISATTGAFGTLIYNWNNGSTTSGITVNGGNHCLTVTDDAGCVNTDCFEVVENPELNANIPLSDIICFGASKIINVNVFGGTPAFNFLWSNGSTNSTTSVPSGTYSVIVTDGVGCQQFDTTIVIESPLLSAQTSVLNTISCFNWNDGSATVLPQGGSAPYNYTWSPYGGVAATANNMNAGTYTITVSDQGGCIITPSVTITEPQPLITTISSALQPSCFGSSNGEATVQTTGGTPSYTYSWTPTNTTGSTATGVSAGTYAVTAQDNNGCTATAGITLTEPTEITFSDITVQNVTCFLGSNGSASALASGGTPGYSYSWSNGATDTFISGLTAGFYNVTATDLNGCTATLPVYVNQPGELWVDSISLINVLCNGANTGQAAVWASGGTTPYSYSWTSTASTSSISTGLFAGTYSVTVTDINGCFTTEVFTITEPLDILGYTIDPTHVSCFEGINGEATLNPTGGAGGYEILWSNNETTFSISGLSAGVFTFQLSDANGCIVNGSVEILEPTQLITTTSTTNVLCANDNTGTVLIDVNGGTIPYSFNWINAPYSTNNPNDLAAGNYEVILSDINGCQDTVIFTINEPLPLLVDVINVVNVLCSGNSDGLIEIEATGGTQPYSYAWTGSISSNPLVTGLAGGQYAYIVSDNNGCEITGNVAITEPAFALAFTINTTNTNCFGEETGEISVNPSGGNGGYEVLWSNNETTFTISALTAGVYSFQLSDLNGCILNGSDEVNEPSAINTTITATNVLCANDNNGSIILTVNGGTPNYNYNWINSTNTTNNASNLSGGSYDVIVIDQNGCKDSLTILIVEPTPLNINIIEVKNVSCNGNSDGLINIEAINGTAPYNYSWTPNGSSTSLITGLQPGQYNYLITDNSGCTLSGGFPITEPTPITVSIPPVGPICKGDAVTLEGFANGGNGGYTFNWDQGLGQGNPHFVSLQNTTTYNLIVTDGMGCSSVLKSITIEVFENPIITFISPSLICAGDNATISANVSSGGGSYIYTWNDPTFSGPGPFTVFPDSTVSYYLNVVDACGIQVNDSLKITVYPYPMVTFSPLYAEGCAPLTVQFEESAVTESGSSYYWSFGNNTFSSAQKPIYTYTSSGQYTVSLTVISPNGCISLSSPNGLVNVYPGPNADFTINPDAIGLINPEINITNNSIGATAWNWDFDDGQFSDEQNPKHSYADTGSYTVNLIVSNNYGCTDQVSKKMKVIPEFSFFIPNAFTPDGDNLNDSFTGIGIGIADFEMHIYDRWGENIFSSFDYEIPWDGTRSGKNLVQIDVYIYVIKVKDLFGIWHDYTGHVTVVR
ncbi:MAG: gliding motility-associated C-terminal domain-containing protein [Bacteroidetes bacterium]|nr:gliding motility-associated C-terminal domain-containing protein [Bacteroidota bacterium]HET6245259.1 PKD domain-containing protein [Bacteroidia bacterium]